MNIPPHYHIVWIVITSPLIIVFLFLIGSFFFLKRAFTRLFRLNDDLNEIDDGSLGEITITDFDNDVMPFIRFI